MREDKLRVRCLLYIGNDHGRMSVYLAPRRTRRMAWITDGLYAAISASYSIQPIRYPPAVAYTTQKIEVALVGGSEL